MYASYSLHEINDEGREGHHLRNNWKPGGNQAAATNKQKAFFSAVLAIAEFSERRELSQHLHSYSVSASDPDGLP